MSDFELRVVYPTGAVVSSTPTDWGAAVAELQVLDPSAAWDATLKIAIASTVDLDVPLNMTTAAPQLGALSGRLVRIVGAGPGTGRATVRVPSGISSSRFEFDRIDLEISNLDFVGPSSPGVELIAGLGNRTSLRSCTFDVVGNQQPLPSQTHGVAVVRGTSPRASLAVEGCLIHRFRTGVRSGGASRVEVRDTVFSDCQVAVLTEDSSELLFRNNVVERAAVGVDYSERTPPANDLPGTIRSRVLDCRFTDCRLGIRATVESESGTLEVARTEFSAPSHWLATPNGPVPRPLSGAGQTAGLELHHRPQPRSATEGAPGWVCVHACVGFMLGVGVELPQGSADGRIRLDHNTFDRVSRAAVALRGDRQAWVPSQRTEFEVGHPAAVPPVLISNNLFLGTFLSYDGAFPPAILLDGDWPQGATPNGLPGAAPTGPAAEPAPPLIVARNAFCGFVSDRPGPGGMQDLPLRMANPIEATGGPSPGGRFFSGAFQHAGTPFENLLNLEPGVAQRARFVSPAEVRRDYHIAAALKTELLDASLPERLRSSTGRLRPLVGGYWGYPSVDGVLLQNRDYWGNARLRVQFRTPGGASLGASERPAYADLPIIINNVTESSNILTRQNKGLSYYSNDPAVEEMADAASYYSALAPAPPGPLRNQVEAGFSMGVRVRPLASLLDEAGLLMLALFPWGRLTGGGVSPGPVLPGVAFTFPQDKLGVTPQFTEWYMPRASVFLRLINEDAQLHRVVAGFEAVEEARANVAGFWRESYLQFRLASMLAAEDREHRGLNMYTQNIDGAATMPATLLPAQYKHYPLSYTNGVPVSLDPLTAAQSLLGELGAEDPQERRLLWDDRGFPVTTSQVSPLQETVTDSFGRASVVYDPDRPYDAPAPQNVDDDPSMTLNPTAVAYPTPSLDDTNYRPWADTARFNISWFPLTDRGTHLLPGSQPVPGNYVDLSIGSEPDPNDALPEWYVEAPNGNVDALSEFNRTWPIHIVERVASGLASAETVANIHSQSVGRRRVFHALHVTNAPELLPRSASHARHDFWVGLHVADALYLHNHARRGTSTQTPHPAWEAYAESFVLLKSTVREYITLGEPVDLGLEFLSAGDLGFGLASPPSQTTGLLRGEQTTEERPGPRLGYLPPRPVLRGSAYRLRNTIVAFITNSFQQITRFRLSPVLAPGESVGTVSGLAGPFGPTPSAASLAGSFDGIDAVVFELSVA